MIKLKLIALAFCLVLSAALTAHAGGMTDAYFSDTESGAISGTIGSWSSPSTLEVGTSTARHWDSKEHAAKVMPIAYFDMDGVLCLDFGDVTPGNHDASPDVVRIRSNDTAAREVTFVVTGSVSSMIGRVGLADHTSLLAPGTSNAVRVQVVIPRDAASGEYTGWLVVTQGGGELRIPLLLTVKPRIDTPKPHPSASPDSGTPGQPSNTPSASPSSVPNVSASPSPDATQVSTPEATPVPTPLNTPLDTP